MNGSIVLLSPRQAPYTEDKFIKAQVFKQKEFTNEATRKDRPLLSNRLIIQQNSLLKVDLLIIQGELKNTTFLK